MVKVKAATDAALASNKDYYQQLSKWQKGVEKKFNQTVLPLLGPAPPSDPAALSSSEGPSKTVSQPFESPEARRALDRVIAMHLVRQGRFSVAETFMLESGVKLRPDVLEACRELHRILGWLRHGDVKLALEWVEQNREDLQARDSPLEFDLHRSKFVRLLTEPTPTPEPAQPTAMATDDPMPVTNGDAGVSSATAGKPAPLTPAEAQARESALAYSQLHFPRFFPTRFNESVRLTSSVLFAPLSRLRASPYADLFKPSAHGSSTPTTADAAAEPWLHADHLVPLFSKEFCTQLGWSRELPLVVATDMGSGGALAKIAKVRSVMKEKRTEWSQSDELPVRYSASCPIHTWSLTCFVWLKQVEIPLPLQYRFHSVFACPVSKEQATASNPPMMMVCGHVIAKESLHKLARGGGCVLGHLALWIQKSLMRFGSQGCQMSLLSKLGFHGPSRPSVLLDPLDQLVMRDAPVCVACICKASSHRKELAELACSRRVGWLARADRLLCEFEQFFRSMPPPLFQSQVKHEQLSRGPPF